MAANPNNTMILVYCKLFSTGDSVHKCWTPFTVNTELLVALTANSRTLSDNF